MNTQPSIPSELARETLKMLVARKFPPTPDNYAKIYAEISGNAIEKDAGPEKVLRGIAEFLAQHSKWAPTGIALKKLIDAEGWEPCIREIEKIILGRDGETIQSWSGLIRNLLRQLEVNHKGLTIARKKESLETVLIRFAANQETLFEKLDGLLRSWSESSIATNTVEINPASPVAPATSTTVNTPASISGYNPDMLGQLLELLAQTLESVLSTQPELAQEVQQLTVQVRNIKTYEQAAALDKQLRPFWIKVELRGNDKTKIHEGMVRLLRLLVENIGEMVEDEEWLHGQIVTLQDIITNPINLNAITDAERSLRDAIIKQSMLKQSLTDAKTTLKSLMTTFIDRLGEITESTGDYHEKIAGFSQKIGKSNNLIELSHLLDNIMQDTQIIQASALRSHEELVGTRNRVHEAEAKIKKLEQELSQVSELVREDHLTGALNRRGLDEAFEREAMRADRSQTQLCIALLDIDDFKRINDTLGHHVGDQALAHLSGVIKEALRPSDLVARYGGEEFIIILPETDLEEAASIIQRLHRELTRKFFLHNNDRILVTFSAGVVQRAPEESQEDAILRADKAMYQAKKSGKNRVVTSKLKTTP
ncbi:MAG: diguanylate cyclase [Candidatus Nitrotoga sp.]